MGWVKIVLGESQSRLYPHMRAKFGRGPTAVSKKVSFNFISNPSICSRSLIENVCQTIEQRLLCVGILTCKIACELSDPFIIR